jgi:hypothetical protein
MGEVLRRVEDAVGAAAQVRGRAHAVEHDGVRRLRLRGIVAVAARGQPYIRRLPPVELLEERPEPVRMLVIDSQRPTRLLSLMPTPPRNKRGPSRRRGARGTSVRARLPHGFATYARTCPPTSPHGRARHIWRRIIQVQWRSILILPETFRISYDGGR